MRRVSVGSGCFGVRSSTQLPSVSLGWAGLRKRTWNSDRSLPSPARKLPAGPAIGPGGPGRRARVQEAHLELGPELAEPGQEAPGGPGESLGGLGHVRLVQGRRVDPELLAV